MATPRWRISRMRHTTRLLAVFLTLALPLVGGCSIDGAALAPPERSFMDPGETSVPGTVGRSRGDAGQGIPTGASAPAVVAPPAGAAPATQPAPGEPRLVIYSAGYRVVVADV